MTKPADIPQDIWETAGDFETSMALSADLTGIDQLIIRESIARAVMAEREAFTPLTVAVSAVVAEAETMTMVMRRRRVFEGMKDRLYATRTRWAAS